MKTALSFSVRSLCGASVLAVAALSSGCASVSRVPSDAFLAADIAITNAQKDQAADFAPAELNAARDKMASARLAVAKNPREKDVVRARRLVLSN